MNTSVYIYVCVQVHVCIHTCQEPHFTWPCPLPSSHILGAVVIVLMHRVDIRMSTSHEYVLATMGAGGQALCQRRRAHRPDLCPQHAPTSPIIVGLETRGEPCR